MDQSVTNAANASSVRSRAILHVEVRLKNATGTFIRTDLIREEVSDWLSQQFLHLKVGQDITSYEGLDQGDLVDLINVTDCSGSDGESSYFRLHDVVLDVQAYQLCDADHGHASQSPPKRASTSSEGDEEDDSPQLRVWNLPNASFDGLWDSLIFDKPIPARLLQYMSRMISISKTSHLDRSIVNWNRLLLLHGPSGGGKTTLCHALAQKLTIRLGRHFTRGKLVEINSHAVLSKWFGESGKLVGKLFEGIHALASDDTTLVCVLIDEVETLTSSREKSANGNECGDALRATNRLLTALDRLRHRSNVVVLATSNLPTALDAAFLDRVDVKQYVPNPSARAAYEILRSSLNGLIHAGLLVAPVAGTDSLRDGPSGSERGRATDEDDLDWDLLDAENGGFLFPQWAEVHVNQWNRPRAPGWRLWKVAERCEGMSGRNLRRLPVLALAMFTFAEPCGLDECLSALETAVDEQVGKSNAGDVDLVGDVVPSRGL